MKVHLYDDEVYLIKIQDDYLTKKFNSPSIEIPDAVVGAYRACLDQVFAFQDLMATYLAEQDKQAEASHADHIDDLRSGS